MKNKDANFALHISLIYIFFSAMWIFFSDKLLAERTGEGYHQLTIATYKGWIFVVVTGLLLYILLRREMMRGEHAKISLRNSEEKFRALFHKANDAIFLQEIKDTMPGRFIEVNDVACRRLGYSRAEFSSMTAEDIIAIEYLEKIPEVTRELYIRRFCYMQR